MKKILLLVVSLAVFENCLAQNLSKEIEVDWIADVQALESAHYDSMTLYLLDSNFVRQKSVDRIWLYRNRNFTRGNSDTRGSGIHDPVMFRENWKIRNKRSILKIVVKKMKWYEDSKRTVAYYKVFPEYFHGKLKKMTLKKIKGVYH